METAELGEVRIKVEDAPAIYVGRTAVEAIRGDANRQADQWLRKADEEWQPLDVSDLAGLGRVRFALSMALDAVGTLIQLAPVPDDDEGDAVNPDE